MLTNTSCVILAGGAEHRFTGPVPRPLQPLCGLPVVGHVLRTIESMGIRDITVVSNAAELAGYLGARASFVRQNGSNGSGDALFRARARIEAAPGDVLVIYGDRPFITGGTLEKLANEARQPDIVCAFASVVLNKPHGHARIMRNESGAVVRTGRDCEIQPQEGRIREVIAGAYFFRKAPLLEAFKALKADSLDQFYVTDITTWLAQKYRVTIMPVEDAHEVEGVYSFKDLAAAEVLMQSQIIDHWVTNGVRIVDPRTTWISAEAEIGENTTIYPNTVIEGPSTIGGSCGIGPFARIRPGVSIGDGAAIGSFVEVVRSRIGDRSRILHLSFVGDAEIGADVMVGAGTITANSDHGLKHKTVVHDEAQIGSGTILVAPVSIGQRAETGAGAVVTKNQNVANGDVVVGVPARSLRARERVSS